MTLRKISFSAMGCQMMAALDTPSPRAKDRLGKIPAWFEGWEQILSRFRDDSELSQLNRSTGADRTVSPELWEVFRLSLEVAERSSGLVSPLVLDALLQAGYSQSFEVLNPSNNGINLKSGGSIPGVEEIHWDAKSHSIQLPPEAHLDFGGVAKGWAANTAMHKMKIYGPVLVDAGGDIAISGLRADGQPWAIAIADPHRPGEQLGMLQVGRGGIATSGIDYRRWKTGDQWQHHIIDPRTGRPAQTDVLSVTVVAPTVIDAEMAAKVVLISGSQPGLEWLARQPNLEGMVVLADGKILESNHFNKYLRE